MGERRGDREKREDVVTGDRDIGETGAERGWGRVAKSSQGKKGEKLGGDQKKDCYEDSGVGGRTQEWESLREATDRRER